MFLLQATKREKQERNPGFIPAILYGSEIKENILINVPEKEFEKVFKEAGESSLIEIEIDGKKYPSLVYGFQKHPTARNFIHIDFFSPNLKEEVEAEVKIELMGTAAALQLGGTLMQTMHILHVKALPVDLPQNIEVDISGLKTFEDYVHVKDLALGDKITILDNPEEVIAHVAEAKPQVEEEEIAKPASEEEASAEKQEKSSSDEKE